MRLLLTHPTPSTLASGYWVLKYVFCKLTTQSLVSQCKLQTCMADSFTLCVRICLETFPNAVWQLENIFFFFFLLLYLQKMLHMHLIVVIIYEWHVHIWSKIAFSYIEILCIATIWGACNLSHFYISCSAVDSDCNRIVVLYLMLNKFKNIWIYNIKSLFSYSLDYYLLESSV